jgi:hypothetical protein
VAVAVADILELEILEIVVALVAVVLRVAGNQVKELQAKAIMVEDFSMPLVLAVAELVKVYLLVEMFRLTFFKMNQSMVVWVDHL